MDDLNVVRKDSSVRAERKNIVLYISIIYKWLVCVSDWTVYSGVYAVAMRGEKISEFMYILFTERYLQVVRPASAIYACWAI